MKNSDILKAKSAEEENDLIAMGIGKQIIREERSEKFEDKWLPKFKDKFGDNMQYIDKMFCWRIIIDDMKHDFYPKANKVFNHKTQKWIKTGLKHLIEKYM